MKKVGICFALVSVITVFCFIGGGCSLIDMLNNLGEEYTDNQEEDSDNNGENGANKNENVTKSVEITPRGMQTVIVGKECVFTANALREDGIHEVERSLSACKKQHCDSKQEIFPVEDGFPSVSVGPLRDYGCARVKNIGLGYGKLSTEKHHGHSHAQKYATCASVEKQKRIIGACA